MRCEVCGRQIFGKPHKVMIEGAKLIVCAECAKLGSTYRERPPQVVKMGGKPVKPIKSLKPIKPIIKVPSKKQRFTPGVMESIELVEGFGSRIRQAREKMGLSHEELGRKIGERISLLRKIETEKMTPDLVLAKKLEHALRIKLLVPFSEPKPPPMGLSSPPKLTLGDVAFLKKRKTEETEKRKPS